MIKFIQTTSAEDLKYTATKSVVMEIEDGSTLPEVLESFKRFLQACGYQITGELVVEEEDSLIKLAQDADD